MGSSLAPVLANIILTEFEKVVVTPLVKSGILKFYCKYVDDTLVLVKEGQIDKILKTFNFFHNNVIVSSPHPPTPPPFVKGEEPRFQARYVNGGKIFLKF